MRLVDLVACIHYFSCAWNPPFCIGRLKYLKHTPNRRFQNRAHFHWGWVIKLSPLLRTRLALSGRRPVYCTYAVPSARATAQQNPGAGKRPTIMHRYAEEIAVQDSALSIRPDDPETNATRTDAC